MKRCPCREVRKDNADLLGRMLCSPRIRPSGSMAVHHWFRSRILHFASHLFAKPRLSSSFSLFVFSSSHTSCCPSPLLLIRTLQIAAVTSPGSEATTKNLKTATLLSCVCVCVRLKWQGEVGDLSFTTETKQLLQYRRANKRLISCQIAINSHHLLPLTHPLVGGSPTWDSSRILRCSHQVSLEAVVIVAT